jgi:lipopolysaccharide transport system permease protein
MKVHLLRHVDLISQLIRRDIDVRFRGSMLGVLWPILTPILTLAMYTIVFGVLMRTKWPGVDGIAGFALVLFPGLILFTLFAECVNRGPILVVSNPNFVKKVVFPLELLPLVPIGTALFNFFLSIVAWILIAGFVNGSLPWTIIFIPVIIIPFILVILGLSWFLSAFGVYLRDIVQIMPLVTQILMFLSPVLYPIENVPKKFVWLIMLNPLSFIVDQLRGVMIDGLIPNFHGLAIYSVISISLCYLGLKLFRALRPGFADIV